MVRCKSYNQAVGHSQVKACLGSQAMHSVLLTRVVRCESYGQVIGHSQVNTCLSGYAQCSVPCAHSAASVSDCMSVTQPTGVITPRKACVIY